MRNSHGFSGRRHALAALIVPLFSVVLQGCGGSEQKTGEVVPVPTQQVEASKSMEDFMNKQDTSKK